MFFIQLAATIAVGVTVTTIAWQFQELDKLHIGLFALLTTLIMTTVFDRKSKDKSD